MDLLPIILSIAQAEGPPSVLGQIIKAIMANEHVALARIWFLDQDGNCPVCGECRRGDGAAHASQRRQALWNPVPTGAGSTAPIIAFRWISDETGAAWLVPESRCSSPISRGITNARSTASGPSASRSKASSVIRFGFAGASLVCWLYFFECIRTRARSIG